MILVDPYSKSPFSISGLRKFRWIAGLLSWLAISKARRAARRLDWPAACAAYASALRLAPENGAIWVQLGHGLANQGHADGAEIAYNNATLAAPRLSLGYKHLGLVRFRTVLHENAMHSLACALFLDPRDKDLRNLLVDAENEANVEACLAKAALALADRHSSPAYIGPRPTILRTKARSAARRRQWVEAERLYRNLTRIRPGDPHAFIQLGHALNEQKKHKEAEEAYRRALAAAPLFPDAWLHLGYVLTARKQHLLAREAFAMVNRIAPARRAEHPILESADPIHQAEASDLPDTPMGKKLICPPGLGYREKSIWLCLARQIESKI
jgi:tetratricopeptide (TPR) repeat protein